MRGFLLTILLALALCGAAQAADGVAAADRQAIQRVITAQIEAFRRDDGPAAFGLAAPAIQRKFGDAGHFLQVVRQVYPVVVGPKSVDFGDVESEGGLVVQKVELVGSTGATALALYDMEREADGSWRISGCRLMKSELQQT